MAHDVFICYSSKDKTTADAVCAVLESEGIRCWIAPRDILVGMSYGEAIVEAIHHAKALVLVFSGHANASPQIEREVERAINQRIPVIPLRIEDVAPDKALEYFLSTPHWLDAFTPPLERHLRNLAGQIHRLIGTTPPRSDAAAEGAAVGAAAGISPFKTVTTPEPPIGASVDTSKGASKPDEKPEKSAAAIGAAAGAAAGAAGASAAGAAIGASAANPSAPSAQPSSTTGASSWVPNAATTKPATSPLDYFKKLDTGAKVGLGAAALVLVIGIGWALSSGGSSTPTPLVTAPGVTVGPNGEVTVGDSKNGVHVGPDGVHVGDNNTPSQGFTPDNGSSSDNGPAEGPPAPAPSSGNLPSDGNVVPGRDTGNSAPSIGTGSGDSSAPSAPQPGVYNSVTGTDVVGVLQEAGYDATAAKDNEGDPMVTGTMEGLKYTIFFYRCNKTADPETCMDLQFHAAFENERHLGNDRINGYNRDNRFGQAYFQNNGDIGLDMSATLQGGVSRQHLKEVIDWWKVTLTGFTRKMEGGG